MPRGRVTAVLALDIVGVRGAAFAFLPAVAFTVVLVTHAFVVWGAIGCGTTLATQAGVTVDSGKPAVVLDAAGGESVAGKGGRSQQRQRLIGIDLPGTCHTAGHHLYWALSSC